MYPENFYDDASCDNIYFESFHPGYPLLEMRVLVRRKLNGIGWHWGLQLPDGLVFHTTAEDGVHLTTLEQFAAGMAVLVTRNIPVGDQADTLRRVEWELANRRRYALLGNNCEDLINRVTGEEPNDGQVQTVFRYFVVGAGLAVAVAAANT